MYNTGKIVNTTDDFNGGIVGATYYNCFGEKIDNTNVIEYGYNIGDITSATGEISQIGPGYMNCEKMYYISGNTNVSGYGIERTSDLFKADASNTDSVLYLLNVDNPGIWAIDSNYNSR